MRKLAAVARWTETARLPKSSELPAAVLALPSQDFAILDRRQESSGDVRRLQATYTRPYQMHASIGPSCAVAQWADDGLTVWTHTHGVYPDRQAIAQMLRVAPG